MTDSITDQIESFPTIPTVVTQLMLMIASPRSTPQDLERVIRRDVSIAAMLLRRANSPRYGHTQEVGSLEKAITVLGFGEVQNLVLLKVFFRSFGRLQGNSSLNIREFWEHSFLCGLAAELLAGELRQSGVDYFAAGLLHDIGKLVMNTTAPAGEPCDAHASQFSPLNMNTLRSEQECFGMNHDEVGERLAKRWKFPECLVAAVRHHHSPEDAAGYGPFVTVVQLADLLAHLAAGPESSKANASGPEWSGLEEMMEVIRSHGLDWDESVVLDLKDRLVVRRKEETDLLDSIAG